MEAVRNTKCAECRRMMCPDEVAWLPMHMFEDLFFCHGKQLKDAIPQCRIWDSELSQFCPQRRIRGSDYCREHALSARPHLCNTITTRGTLCGNMAGHCRTHNIPTNSRASSRRNSRGGPSHVVDDVENVSWFRQNHQCVATTALGRQCLHPALSGEQYCRVHMAHQQDSASQPPHSPSLPNSDNRCVAVTRRGEQCTRPAQQNALCAQHAASRPRRPRWDIESHGPTGMGPVDHWLLDLQGEHGSVPADCDDTRTEQSIGSGSCVLDVSGTQTSFNSGGQFVAEVEARCEEQGCSRLDSLSATAEEVSCSESTRSNESSLESDMRAIQSASHSGSENGREQSEDAFDEIDILRDALGQAQASAEATGDDFGADDDDHDDELDGDNGNIAYPNGNEQTSGTASRKCIAHTLHPGWALVRKHPFVEGDMATRAAVRSDCGLCFAVCTECKAKPRRHFFSVIWPDEAWFVSLPVGELSNRLYGEETFNPPTHNDLFWLSPVRICDSALSGTVVRTNTEGEWRNPRYQLLALTGDGRGLSTQYVSLDLHPSKRILYRHGSPLNRSMHIQTILHWRRDLLPFFRRLYGSSQGVLQNNQVAIKDGFIWNEAESDWVAEVPFRGALDEDGPGRVNTLLEDGPPGWVAPRTLPRIGNHALGTAVQVIMQLRFARTMLLGCGGLSVMCVFNDLQYIVNGLLRGHKPNTVLHKELLYDLRDQSARSDNVALTAQEVSPLTVTPIDPTLGSFVCSCLTRQRMLQMSMPYPNLICVVSMLTQPFQP